MNGSPLRRRTALPITMAAFLAVSGCSKSPEDFEPTPVPDAERVTDAATLEDTRWELTADDQLLGEESGYFEFCTSPSTAQVVTTILLRADGFVDTRKECEPIGVGVPDFDQDLPDVPGLPGSADITDGESTGLRWELDDEGWLRFENKSGFRCEADGVAAKEFQMICFGDEDTVFERQYSKG